MRPRSRRSTGRGLTGRRVAPADVHDAVTEDGPRQRTTVPGCWREIPISAFMSENEPSHR